MVKAILFDLGGVLFTNGAKKFIDDLSARHGLERETVRDAIEGDVGARYRESKITRDEFWRSVISRLKINENADALEKEWINDYRLVEGTRVIIIELRRKYKVYYLSDNVKERVKELNEKFRFSQWFDGGVFSHEAGVKKPDPRIYTLALEKANVRPEEAVFIDDKQSCVDTAAGLGMMTFLFETPEKLKSELKQKGIL